MVVREHQIEIHRGMETGSSAETGTEAKADIITETGIVVRRGIITEAGTVARTGIITEIGTVAKTGIRTETGTVAKTGTLTGTETTVKIDTITGIGVKITIIKTTEDVAETEKIAGTDLKETGQIHKTGGQMTGMTEAGAVREEQTGQTQTTQTQTEGDLGTDRNTGIGAIAGIEGTLE